MVEKGKKVGIYLGVIAIIKKVIITSHQHRQFRPATSLNRTLNGCLILKIKAQELLSNTHPSARPNGLRRR